MKNLFFTLFIATVLFSSCSKEESVANTTIPPVESIKRISKTTFYNGTARTYGADFNYEHVQLKSLNGGSIGSFELVMEGNKIVQTKSIVNNAVSDANNITYEGNNLKLIQQGDGSEKTEYNYINGQLASEPSSYSTNVGPFVLSTLNSYTFSSNQNIACKILSFYQGINSSFKSSFEYDNKNSVFKNMNPYLKFLFNFESLDIKSNNNVLKQFSHSTPTANDSTQSHYYTIIYNDNNFPISVKKHQFGNNELISECTISYN